MDTQCPLWVFAVHLGHGSRTNMRSCELEGSSGRITDINLDALLSLTRLLRWLQALGPRALRLWRLGNSYCIRILHRALVPCRPDLGVQTFGYHRTPHARAYKSHILLRSRQIQH
jgi:hypothetical protein